MLKKSPYLRYPLIIIAVIAAGMLLFYKFWFLRLPDRDVPNAPSSFVSPANGVISAVQPWSKDTVLIEKEFRKAVMAFTESVGDHGHLVSIMMNLQNVHYQRAPINSKLIDEYYQPGRFNNATVMSNRYGIRFENEYNSMLFETEKGTRYKVIQIAGFLARRIVSYLDPGQTAKQGEVIGLIKMGSQVTLVFPGDVAIKVKEGDHVVDGETIVAEEL